MTAAWDRAAAAAPGTFEPNVKTREELREAIARAICITDGEDPDEMLDGGIAPKATRWECYLPHTDAALSTIASLGLAIVPVEATERMLKDGAMQIAMRMQRMMTAEKHAEYVWRYMLSASPFMEQPK